MKTVKGFAQARELLDRSTVRTDLVISDSLKERLTRMFDTVEPEQAVQHIIKAVKKGGDTALFELALKIDRIKLSSLEVIKTEIQSAYDNVDSRLVTALKLAAKRIQAFHTLQKAQQLHELSSGGLGQLIRPLARVGVYAPGGTAFYPSTVLMTAIPAKVAGVEEIILVTPPASDGRIPAPTLVAADIAGVDRIFVIGGAQAVAAMAYGTESVPRVDKICGPGNIFVMLAKKLVYGVVAIDGLQGPSEVVIIADETAKPAYCAADLLAQSEHDPLASPVMITTSASLADKVDEEIEKQLEPLKRRNIAGEALKNGVIAIVDTVEEAIELANLFAPEHLELMIADAPSYLPKIRNAGCVFTGNRSAVVLGDYIAGPSHVLPTGGTARFSSPLNVMDFVKFINTIDIDQANLEELGATTALMARAEGLEAHARAVEKRLEGEK